jgi:hypothetical protein
LFAGSAGLCRVAYFAVVCTRLLHSEFLLKDFLLADSIKAFLLADLLTDFRIDFLLIFAIFFLSLKKSKKKFNQRKNAK